MREYLRRLNHLAESYLFWSSVFASSPTVNQSLTALDRALHHPKRKQHAPMRLHPEIEFAISYLASKEKEVGWSPTQQDIQIASRELVRRLRPIKGRPGNRVLRHHVQGLMILCEWASGVPVTASPTTNSTYEPQMSSDGAKVIQSIFQKIDPAVTITSLMNIVRGTRASRAIEGKRFEDFFPGYASEADPRGPRVRTSVKVLGTASPIYCS